MPNSLFFFFFFSYKLLTDFNHVQITDIVKVCLNLVCFSFPLMFFIFLGPGLIKHIYKWFSWCKCGITYTATTQSYPENACLRGKK